VTHAPAPTRVASTPEAVPTPSSPSGRPAAARPGSAPRRRRRPGRVRDMLLFLAFVGPNVLLLAVFTYKPLLESFYYSTLQWNIGSSVAREVGLANYVAWFQDPQTPTVVRVTVIFTGVTVVGSMLLGLGVAVLLNRRIKLRGPVRTIIVAPYVLSGVAVGFLWLYVFDPNFGVISAGLTALGLTPPDWYSDPAAALAMVTTVQVWRDLGYCALIYLAGLQAVPKDLLDAAALDGAGRIRTFLRVVLPLLSPTTFFLSVTTLLSSLQTFDLISAMTKGGPLQGTTTMMYQIYHEGFVAGRAGYSSAVATILFLVLLVVTLVQLVIVQRKVHYS